MRPANKQSDPTLPLTTTVFNILLALADNEKHGYAIMREIEEQTAGTVKMGPGTLYGSLDRMQAAGLVEETESRNKHADDPRRRYYRLTDYGLRVLQADAARLRLAVNRARLKGVLRPARGTSA